MKRPGHNRSPAFKTRVALEAIKVAGTGCRHYDCWSRRRGYSGAGAVQDEADCKRIRGLHGKIGELAIENDFLPTAVGRFPDPGVQMDFMQAIAPDH